MQNVIVGSYRLALEAALLQAKSEGLYSRSLSDCWQGEARTIAAELCQIVKTTQEDRPFCFIAGGETTVTLHGRNFGRNACQQACHWDENSDQIGSGLEVTMAYSV